MTKAQQLELIQANLKINKFASEIVYLTTVGLSNKEIANQLFLDETAVKNHLSCIYQDTGLSSRAKLIIKCLPYLEFYTNEVQ